MQTGRLDVDGGVLEKSDVLPDVYKSSAVCPLYGWGFRPVNNVNKTRYTYHNWDYQ